MIRYTSVEGPEAAIYIRGTLELVDGHAHIQFPDHFSSLAVPSSITATLTPRSALSKGLAVVDTGPNGIEVMELSGGTGNYSFDYLVHAVRKGFEDYQVYVPKDQVNGVSHESTPLPLVTTEEIKAIEGKK